MVILAVGLLTTSLAGCIGDTGGDGLQEASRNETEARDGNQTTPTGPIQETTASWLTGTNCQGVQVSSIGTTDGIDHDTFQVAGASLGQPFTAELASDAAPVSWTIFFIAPPSVQPVDAYETSGDTIEGIVPDEPVMGVVLSCLGTQHEMTFTVMGGEE